MGEGLGTRLLTSFLSVHGTLLPPVHAFHNFPMPQGLYCAEEVQRWMKKLNGKCQNKRMEEEKTQESTEKSLKTE